MKTLRRFSLWFVLIVLLLLGATGLWLNAQKQQYSRNRQLIAALTHNDTKAALALVNAGADPNTRRDPTLALTLSERVDQWLHRLPQSENASPTALMLLCSTWPDEHQQRRKRIRQNDQRLQIAKALLTHGAHVNASSSEAGVDGAVALDCAVSLQNIALIQLLLDHGADPTRSDEFGRTPITWAETMERHDIATLLRKYSKHL